jgi:D-galactose 1-dehydrogenase
MNMKIALVSIGKIARDQHIPRLSESKDWELAAAVSRSATVDGVENFADFGEMLTKRPDIGTVSLCMPPAARFDYAAAAIAAGRHVMLEKPPGATLSECFELERMAKAKGLSLFATWHSRYAVQVPAAKAWMADKTLKSVAITWKEDVRRWHPGQDWIWEAGGLGVFDPGINALSILTHILPRAVFVKKAVLEFPANRDTPIAADLVFHDPGGAAVTAVFDWRQEGPQTWDIAVEAAEGRLLLQNGGAKLLIDGKPVADAPDLEYAGLYARMAELVRTGTSDVDLAPMAHVADAYALGLRKIVDAFTWEK